MKIQEGDIIAISGKKYDVLKVLEEADQYDPKNNKAIGEHTRIELHDLESTSLHPTHLLKIYHNDKEVILLQIKQENIPNPLRGMLKVKKGGSFSYHNKKEISIKDIQFDPKE